jgi:sialate O-acetylesterase
MNIVTGLFDQMVVQRNRRNVSEAAFKGECEADGAVLATVYRGKRVVAGLSGIKAGKAVSGFFSGCLKGMPVGGPYDVKLTVGHEQVVVSDVLVGDVWLLGGQSNMQGCGVFPPEPLAADPQVRAFFMDDRWAPAVDCIHNLWDAVDPVHVDLCGRERCGQ